MLRHRVLTAVASGMVTLCLCAALAGPPPDGKDLLANGGFEKGTDGWRTLNMSQEASFELDRKVKHGGKQSLRFEKKGRGRPDFLKASVDLPTRKGKLAVSIACRVANDSRVRIEAYFSDAQGDTVGKGYMTVADARPTKTFEVARAEYDIPSTATNFGINVVMEKPGTVWIDDASVTMPDAPKAARKKTGANLLDNGTFDEDIEGWMPLAHGSGTSEAERDTRVKASGAGALSITRTSPRLFPEDGVQATVLEPGDARQYKLSFKARVDGGARAILAVQAFDESGVVVETRRETVTATGFAAGSIDLRLARPCDRIVVSFAVGGAGKAWLDDVGLEGK